jgi:hypothetical protein
MAEGELPVLSTVEVGKILGQERQDGKTGPLPAATVRQYLADSRSGRRFKGHGFPEPKGKVGRSPVWLPSQEQEIREWARTRLGSGARTDLTRDTD